MNPILRLTALLSTIALLLPISLEAQDSYWIGDDYSGVQVTTDMKGGRFFFTSGNATGRKRYLYGGSTTDGSVTSNVVFRLQRSSGDQYFSNTPVPFFSDRPRSSAGEATFAPFDSLYISPGEDTLEVIWKNLGNTFFVIQRFVVEGVRHEYDNGSDILLEFEYRINQGAPAAANLGIFLMLDLDQRFVQNGSDNASLLTDRKYYKSNEYGDIFQKQFGQMPEFYQVGGFEYHEPVSEIFAIHRLRGRSLGGALLDEPNELAIGHWNDFRKLTWLINGDVTSKQIPDIATAMRWENLGTGGKIRTAFGTSSQEGNNLYNCRDLNIFVTLRTERVVRQATLNGPYEPEEFEIEMWVTNLSRALDQEIEIGFDLPFRSWPDNSGRLTLAPGDPAIRELILLPRQTKKLTWRAQVNRFSNDTLAEMKIVFRDSIRSTKKLKPLLQGCTPKVSFVGAFKPPPPDNREPVIEELGNGRDVTRWWNLRTYDRHAGYIYDTGLDKIEITRNDGNNMRLIQTPNTFGRCDTGVTVGLRFEVIDTTRSALMVVKVTDCEGNSSSIQRAYAPRPDPFTPVISRIDTVRRFILSGFPCSNPIVDVTVIDSVQRPDAGDLGFGSVKYGEGPNGSTNVLPLLINPHRGGAAIAPGDGEVRFRIEVADTMLPANATVVYADLAGNADTFKFSYCPLPDTSAPEFSLESGNGPSWTLQGSDTASWDRGLLEIVEISSTNMTTEPLPGFLTPGDRSFGGLDVSVVDDAWPAEITLELRDTWYDPDDQTTHAPHSRRLSLTWPGIEDTLAPIITLTRDLTVPPNQVVFNVSVVDSHEVSGQFYRYDRGLRDVSWTLTPNMQVRTPIVYTDNRRGATFSVEVIDLFTLADGDTLCVSAVDSAGNRAEEVCREYPIEPDHSAPLFRGRILPDRSALNGIASDERPADRGLYEVSVRNGQNVDETVVAGLDGAPTAEITASILDPTAPIAGEVVVRDLHDELEGLPDDSIHTTIIPFSLPVILVEMRMPRVVDGGDTFPMHIINQSTFSGADVRVLEFGVTVTNNGVIISAGGPIQVNSVIARSAGGITTFTVVTNSGVTYRPGDTLATMNIQTSQPATIDMFEVRLDASTVVVNQGMEDTIRVFAEGDTTYSELILPSPYMRALVDSQTVINGDCNRVLGGGGGAGRPVGPEILALFPNPTGRSGGSPITVYVRDVPEGGGTLLLFNAAGVEVARFRIESNGEAQPVSSAGLPLPVDLPEGSYYLMIEEGKGTPAYPFIVQ